MVETDGIVVIANAMPPEDGQPALVQWEYATTPTAELSDSENSQTSTANDKNTSIDVTIIMYKLFCRLSGRGD